MRNENRATDKLFIREYMGKCKVQSTCEKFQEDQASGCKAIINFLLSKKNNLILTSDRHIFKFKKFKEYWVFSCRVP